MTSRGRGRPPAGDPATISTEELLDAALDAFAERGYEATSVRELARSLGVSHNLIPQRIGTKEQLWYAAIDRGFGVLAAALAEAVRDHPDLDDVARLRLLVVRFIEANALRPALLRILTQEATAPGPRLDHIFDAYIAPVADFGEGLLQSLRDQGAVTDVPVSLLYFLMTHGAGGPLALPALADRLGASVDPTDATAVRRHAEAAADLLFDGIRAGRHNIDTCHETY